MRPVEDTETREGEARAAECPGWAQQYADIATPRHWTRFSLRDTVRHTALVLGGSVATFGDAPFLRCLYGHYVFDDQVDQFRALMTRLRAIGRFVGTAEVVDVVSGRKPITERTFHLSFDDGFDNVYRNALPVLNDLGIPATVFVPTSFVGASDEETLQRWWRRDEIARPTRSVRWEWLREMVKLGFDVGSHTRTHARLASISSNPKRLTEEVAGSKDDLEQQLGMPCRYFAWPYGRWIDIDDRSLRTVEEAGYEACFSAVRGRVVAGETRRFAIPRHKFEPEWPWSHVRFFAAGGREGA